MPKNKNSSKFLRKQTFEKKGVAANEGPLKSGK